jgi:hypothetical protein
MSYLKSSLFYLKDINNFLKEKHDQYKTFDNYIQTLYMNEKELVPFLERVIMNVHNYFLNKQRFIDDAKRQISMYNSIRICLILVDTFITTLLTYFIWEAYNEVVPSKKHKMENILAYIIAILIVNFALVSIIKTVEHRMYDFEGRVEKRIPVEDIFMDFHRKEGVALYYALRRGFTEPTSSKYRKDIKKYYKIYTPTKNGITSYPTLQDVRLHKDYKNIVASVRNTLTTKFETAAAKPELPTQSNYASIDKQLRYSDTTTLVRETTTQGNILNTYVANVQKEGEPLNPSQIHKIIEDEIVPLFSIKQSIYEVEGLKIKNPSDFRKSIGAPETVSSNIECMLKCEMNDACLVAAYQVSSKTCNMVADTLPKGTHTQLSNDDLLYVKSSTADNNIFVEGGEVRNAVQTYDTEVNGVCISECLAGENCVKYIKDKKCTISTGEKIDIDNIIPKECKNAGELCTYYKQDIKQIGKSYDIGAVLEHGKEKISQQIVSIVQKYKYEINILDNSELIQKSLANVLGQETFNNVADKVRYILDISQSKADKSRKTVKHTVVKYIASDQFVKKFNEMTYGEFASFYYCVDSLDTTVTALNTIVQSNIANNLSGEDSIFLAQERKLKMYKFALVFVSIITILGFIYYHSSNSSLKGVPFPPTPKNRHDVIRGPLYSASFIKIESLFSMTVPLVIIFFFIILMSSLYIKARALYRYNREILEKNGGNLTAAIDDLEKNVKEIQQLIVARNKRYSLDTKMSEMNISSDQVKEIYNSTIRVVELLDKCNLLTDGSSIKLPFPWTDVTLNIVLIAVSIFVVGFVIMQIEPIRKFNEIRELNILFKKLKDGLNVDTKFLEYDEDDDIGPVLKIIAFIVFFIIIILFSQKLIGSSNDYERGLYNSRYYMESKCVV